MASRFNHLCRSVKVALFLLSICSVGLAAARSQSTIPAAGEFWPTKGWRASRPEAQGLDSDVLADAFDFLREKHVPIHSLLIERNGWIILDAYFSPFSDNQLHDLASVTKSVTSTLVGIAIGQGKLAGVDERVSSIFPE